MPDPRAIQFDHLSFNVPDEEALLRSPAPAASSAGCEVTDVVDHGIIRSIYFTDPNGIALEASWWVARRDRPPGRLRRHRAVRRIPDPVPAVRELAESGQLSSVPATHLV